MCPTLEMFHAKYETHPQSLDSKQEIERHDRANFGRSRQLQMPFCLKRRRSSRTSAKSPQGFQCKLEASLSDGRGNRMRWSGVLQSA